MKMNAIDIMNRCRNAASEINRLNERIARYRACATDSAAHINQTGRVQGSGGDSVSSFAVAVGDCERQRERRKQEYEAESYCACKLLDELPETECTVLYRYYVGVQTVGGIAAALRFTTNYVKRKKADGLMLLEKIDISMVLELLPEWYTEGVRADCQEDT